MTGHHTTTRWETTAIADAVTAILNACLTTRAPDRTTCPDCRALIHAGHPCPICVEIRRRQYEHLHKTA